MKRGFLLRAEERKAAARRRAEQKHSEPPAASTPAAEHRTDPQISKGSVADEKKLAYGNLTEEEKALPTDYDPNTRQLVYKEIDPTITKFKEDVVILTSIPQPAPKDETQSEWIVNGSTKAKVFNAPGYPARIPKPRRPDLYEVKSTPDCGLGLFAKHDLKRGDLIFAERPLLVTPRGMRAIGPIPDRYTTHEKIRITISEFESYLETAIARLPPKGQADFRALHNSHTDDGSGPLLGILRTNNYGINNLYDDLPDDSNEDASYGAVCKIGSRLNHSCKPNVKSFFKCNSFSMQFHAIRDIKAGDQLFFSYCSARGSVAERSAELAPYGFVCKCPACVNATPETDKLRNTFEAQIDALRKMVTGSQCDEAALKDALRLEQDMIKEGLDAHLAFVALITLIYLAYVKLGRLMEGERYGVLVEEFQRCGDFGE